MLPSAWLTSLCKREQAPHSVAPVLKLASGRGLSELGLSALIKKMDINHPTILTF